MHHECKKGAYKRQGGSVSHKDWIYFDYEDEIKNVRLRVYA